MTIAKLETTSIKVADVMSNHLVTVTENAHVLTAVNRLLSRGVGCALVMDEEDHVVGIITKGDVLREVVTKGLEPKKVRASEIMSEPVTTIDAESTMEQACRLMIQKRISKLPVVKNGDLVGIITATDIIRTQPLQVEYLQELIRARFVPRDLRY